MSEQSAEIRLSLELFLVLKRMEVEVPVTIFVKGTIISGTLISASEYFEEMTKLIRRGSGNLNEAMADALDKAILAAKDSRTDEKTEQGKVQDLIHLKDVRILMHNQLIAFQIWEGRIDSVDGWFPGLLESNSI